MPETPTPIDAFATVEEFAARTGRTVTDDQRPQIESLLEDATSYLRGIVGNWITPIRTVTVTLPGGYSTLPAYTRNVIAVERDDVAVTGWSFWDGDIFIPGDDHADATWSQGLATAPTELRRWTIVLVAQALSTLELGLGLTAGGLSSLAIDDFRAAFADGGESTGMSLSERAESGIRKQFGWIDGAVVVETRRV